MKVVPVVSIAKIKGEKKKKAEELFSYSQVSTVIMFLDWSKYTVAPQIYFLKWKIVQLVAKRR